MNSRKKMEKRVAELEDSMMRVKRLYKIEREKLSSEDDPRKTFTDSIDNERHEIASILGEITFEKNAFWRREAGKRLVEIPDDDSMFTGAEGFGEMNFLTDKAIARIHHAIKLDQREHWKFIATIVSTIISLVIGLIGSTIALLSFLSKHSVKIITDEHQKAKEAAHRHLCRMWAGVHPDS